MFACMTGWCVSRCQSGCVCVINEGGLMASMGHDSGEPPESIPHAPSPGKLLNQFAGILLIDKKTCYKGNVILTSQSSTTVICNATLRQSASKPPRKINKKLPFSDTVWTMGHFMWIVLQPMNDFLSKSSFTSCMLLFIVKWLSQCVRFAQFQSYWCEFSLLLFYCYLF